MNTLKLASKSFAYSWDLIFESSKFMIFLYFALMLIATSLRERNSADDRVLIDWLMTADEHNGFYILGV